MTTSKERHFWIMRAWHQGGVNWTHLPDIAKWLEQTGSNYFRVTEVLSGILIISLSLFAFCTRFNRCHSPHYSLVFAIRVLDFATYHKLPGQLFLASGHGATFTAQLIYAVLGISTCFATLVSPWLPHSCLDEQCFDMQLSVSQPAPRPVIHQLGGLKESSVIGWTYMLSWSLLQLLLQQPINLMPVSLLLLQITAAMIYFSNDRAGRRPCVKCSYSPEHNKEMLLYKY